jgi:Holliday junction resolvasome RuvABC endonuclease subunit
MPHVLSTNGWAAMRWERWTGLDPATGNCGMEVLDTSGRSPEQVAAEVVTWSRRALNAEAPLLHAAGGVHRAT